MPTLIPQLKVTTKAIFVCELLLAATMDVDKICNWLRENHASEIIASQKDVNHKLFWAINFCTDNEQFVLQLQNRCKEKTDEALQQKEQHIEDLMSQLKAMNQKFNELQSRIENQDSIIVSLKDERERLRHRSISLRQLESDHQSLRRAYQNQHSELVEIKSELKRSQPEIIQSTNEREIVSSGIHISIDTCIICGRPAMPGQGQCLDCAR
jgi:chromosome segregation ATPase